MTDVHEEPVALEQTAEAAPEQPVVEAKPVQQAQEVEPERAPQDQPEQSVEPEEHVAPKTNKRIRDILAENKRLKEAAEAAQAELAKLKTPTLEEFDHDIEQYTDAKLEHQLKKRDVVQAAGNAERAEQDATAAINAEWQRINHAAVKQYPDFSKVVSAPDVPISKDMAEAMLNSDSAADIAYFLGKNKAEAARIFALPPHLQGYEIAKIENKAKPVPLTSNAPAPPNARVHGIGGAGQKSYDEMTDAEFSAARARERAEWRARNL